MWLADHSSRGILPTLVRLCVWSRNLVNEEALVHWELSRQKQTNRWSLLVSQVPTSSSTRGFTAVFTRTHLRQRNPFPVLTTTFGHKVRNLIPLYSLRVSHPWMATKCLARVLVFGLRTLTFYQKVALTVISKVVYVFVVTWEREQLLLSWPTLSFKNLMCVIYPFCCLSVYPCACVFVWRGRVCLKGLVEKWRSSKSENMAFGTKWKR